MKQGQLLATLEIPELQADFTKAKSDVQTANAERAVAQGDLQRAQAASQMAQLSYSRIQDVSKKEPGLVPLQEVDVAHAHNLEADAQVSAALQRVQAAESRYQAPSPASLMRLRWSNTPGSSRPLAVSSPRDMPATAR